MSRTPEEIMALLRQRSKSLTAMDPLAPKSVHGGYSSATAPSPVSTGSITSSTCLGIPIAGNVFAGMSGNGNGNMGQGVTSCSFNYGIAAPAVPTSPILPTISIIGHGEHGQVVRLTLEPERSISGFECLQILMMMHAYNESSDEFCPLAFIKLHNLERHFKFS